MDDRDQRRYNAYDRGRTFCNDHAGEFAPTSDFHTHAAALDTALKATDAAGADRVGGGNASKVAILDAISIDCRNIHRTAGTIAQDEPGFAEPFPPAEHNDASIITTCDAYLKQFEAAPGDTAGQTAAKTALIARFVAKELPSTFVTDLRADRNLYSPTSGAQETKRRGNVEDTEAIETDLGEAAKQVRYLNAIMHNKYTRDPETLRGWKSAIHIARDPKKKPPPAESDPATGKEETKEDGSGTPAK
ncbi:MAG TPA: hypothetical protein VGG02_09725 [Chthoniobacterales bacterium]|jgi:hypothetical protein